MDVLQVGNDFGVLCMCQCCCCDVWVIVIDIGYVIEQMGEVGGIGLQCGYVFFVCVSVVVELYVDVYCCQCGYQCGVFVDFWSQCYYLDWCECVQLLYQCQCCFDCMVGLCIQVLWVDEWFFQMYVDDVGGVGIGCCYCCSYVLQCVFDFIQVGGYGGCQQCGGIEVQMGVCDGVCDIVILYQVDVGCIVYVQVDEVGQDYWQLQVVSVVVVIYLQLVNV